MSENWINGAVGLLSMYLMALLGVDYYSLLWSLIGSLLAAAQAEKMGRLKAMFFVVFSTLLGAAMGNGLASFASTVSRPSLILVSLVCGFGSQAIIVALLKAVLSKIGKAGGSDGTP